MKVRSEVELKKLELELAATTRTNHYLQAAVIVLFLIVIAFGYVLLRVYRP